MYPVIRRIILLILIMKNDKGKCQKAINSIAFNAAYEKEVASLISSANELLISVCELKSQLSNKMQDVCKHWPGTKVYTFKRIKQQCPECRKIP